MSRRNEAGGQTENKRTKIIIAVLCAITLLAVGVSIFALLHKDKPSDYAPQQIEQNAEPIKDEDSTEKLEQQSGGGAVSLTYSNQVTLSLSKKTVSLMFQNPTRSNQDMKVEIVIDGKTIAESGRLEPGFKVDTLSEVDTDKLSAGTYEGKFVVSFYDAESGEKAVVNTEIPITITVEN